MAPVRAGYVRVDSLGAFTGPTLSQGALHQRTGGILAAIGGRVQTRLKSLYPRSAPLATALVWARKDGLAPEIREAFARAGTAHLLAISGFHVGVVAGVLLLFMGSLGLPHAARFLWASIGVWLYVIAIGVPDAAFRAATLLSTLALGRTSNRSVAPQGALATAFLAFVAWDPGALLRPGFQLSFAGALGLVAGYGPVSGWLSLISGGRLPLFFCKGIAAGISATVATLPLVAWHFGRVSLIGIPLTFLVAPLVSVAIPGVFASLLLSMVQPAVARFLASGVEVVLGLISAVVGWAGGLPFASVWIPQPTVVWATLALVVSGLLLTVGTWVPRWGRTGFLGSAVVAGVLFGPPAVRFLNLGVVELVVLDVGQGDAALLRSPAGRWVLVDAGPRSRTFDAGARTILPYLRRRGVESLDLMILTHPDMDHVGGAASILENFRVNVVLDPGIPAGTEVFLDALSAARDLGLPWKIAEAGDSLDLDGMALRFLAPEVPAEDGAGEGNNAASLVLEVRFGAFALLLAGDAPAASEERFLPRLLAPRFQVLKVGHHGSTTSTTYELVSRTNPEAALISVGRRNRFGHPHPEVLARLRETGARVFRTDLHGTLTVKARRDGTYSVSSQFQ